MVPRVFVRLMVIPSVICIAIARPSLPFQLIADSASSTAGLEDFIDIPEILRYEESRAMIV